MTTQAVENPVPSHSEVIEAMRSVQTEGNNWQLADALKSAFPTGGLDIFVRVIDEATQEGIAGSLTANTLRLYRDTAMRWPAEKRVANLGFSVHREAMVLESIDTAARMLKDLSNNLGPSKVTVAEVRKAIAAKQGKTPAAKAGANTSQKALDVLNDLRNGGPSLIQAISPATTGDDLDKFHAGLSKVLTHVDRLRSKAARKNQPTKLASVKSGAPAKVQPKKAAAGDVRGL